MHCRRRSIFAGGYGVAGIAPAFRTQVLPNRRHFLLRSARKSLASRAFGAGEIALVWIGALALASPLALLAGTTCDRAGRLRLTAIAVLPFTNAGGDANTEYLSDGITESLIDNLAHVPQLKVKSRRSVFRYKGKDVDVRKVGADLGISALVSGRVSAARGQH